MNIFQNQRIMKQHTNSEQTAKLIELGFVPKAKIKEVRTVHSRVEIDHDCNFTIGELMEILDTVNETVHCRFGGVEAYLVSTNSGDEKIGGSLINLLFDLCVKLKEEGVI